MSLRATLPGDTFAYLRTAGEPGQVGIAAVRYFESESLIQITGVSPPVPDQKVSAEDVRAATADITPSKLYQEGGPIPDELIEYRIDDGNGHATPPQGENGRLTDSVLIFPPQEDNDEPPRLKVADEVTEVHVIRTDDAVFERVAGIVDTDYLSEVSVAIVGLGTGGSTVAVELAKCGVGTFHLYDPDTLDVHNVSRHVCDLSDVGRKKVYAIQDVIQSRNPSATVETYPINVLEDRQSLRDGVRDADCVLACTDTQHSRAVINEETVAFHTPAIYAGAFERAYGGNVVRYDPTRSNETPCHACIYGTPDPMENAPRNPDGSLDYGAAPDAESSALAAEPGLSVDVGFIALFQTRYALETLARDAGADTSAMPYEIIRWGNRAHEEFDEPFQRDWIQIGRDGDCPVCGPDGIAAQLRKSRATTSEAMTDETSTDEQSATVKKANDLGIDL